MIGGIGAYERILINDMAAEAVYRADLDAATSRINAAYDRAQFALTVLYPVEVAQPRPEPWWHSLALWLLVLSPIVLAVVL